MTGLILILTAHWTRPNPMNTGAASCISTPAGSIIDAPHEFGRRFLDYALEIRATPG